MGGLCGIIGLSDRSLIAKMSDAIRHRGTRQELLIDNYVSLCSRASDSKQIIEHEDVKVIFDGEMYNKCALIQDLEKKGHYLSSETDAEVLAHLFKTYRESCVDKIRGPFAFAIWDSKKKALFLAKDKAGERPIFYTFSSGYLLFASEIKAFLRTDIVKKNVDPLGLTYFFLWGHVPFPITLFKGIRKLPSASMMEFSERKLVLQEYWKPNLSKIDWGLDEEIWCKVIHDTITDCIQTRLDKGPFGILLGGLDSSATASLIKDHAQESLKSFTVTYENEEFNEPYARFVSEWLGIEHHEKRLYAKDLIRILPELVYLIDDPKADVYSTPPTYPALELAKKYVRTIFTADGADMNFWGNPPCDYAGFEYSPALVRLSQKTERIITFVIDRWNLKQVKTCISYHSIFNKGNSVVTKTQSPIKLAIKLAASTKIARGLSLMAKVRRLHKLAESAGWGISRLERICSAFSLNLRLPFEDSKIKEVTSKIPPYLKQPNRYIDKYIWRKTISKYGLLPKKVINQKKRGFGDNYAVPNWIKGELRDFVYNNVLEITPHVKSFLDERAIIKCLREGRTRSLYRLLIFALWYNKFFLEGNKNCARLP